MRILVTGGAGYVGNVLVPVLLEHGEEVIVVDKLLHGGDGLLSCFRRPGFRFVRGDVCDRTLLQSLVSDSDFIVHLAAYVGYPICKKHPDDARKTNLDGTLLLNEVRGDVPMVFASTCSNYGAAQRTVCDEHTPLNPVTLYAETKCRGEQAVQAKGNSVCLRFATAFGVSPRLRLDLLVNDFCHRAKLLKSLIVYEGSFRRPFIHVFDISRAIIFTMENFADMSGEVYNVGDEKLNVTKAYIANMIRQRVDFYLHFADIAKDEDRRNYDVSFSKIASLGYEPTVSLEEGIDELLAALDVVNIKNTYSNV